MGVMVYFWPVKKYTNQYYELDSLDAGNSSTMCEYMILQDDKCIITTEHTWTAVFLVFLKHLMNMSFVASFWA
jgi:hypothetical protein